MASVQEDVGVIQPTVTSLQMDYWAEELSEAQSAYYSKVEKEVNEIMSKVQNFINNENGEILECGSDVMVLQGSTSSPALSVLSNLVTPVSQVVTNTKNRLIPIQTSSQLQAVSSPQLVLQTTSVQAGSRISRTTASSHQSFQTTSATFPQPAGTFNTPQGTIQLVMDPRLGILVGTVPNQQGTGNQIIQTTAAQPSQPLSVPTVATARGRPNSSARSVIKPTVTTSSQQAPRPVMTTAVTSTTSTYKAKHRTAASIVSSSTPVSPATIPASVIRPTENNCVGGLSAGSPAKKTDDGKSKASGPDSREVAFNKLSGKTFPSLVVLARPNLRVKDMPQAKVNSERAALDSKVKCVLMYNATKFTEWLIQQGLVRSEQYCNTHFLGDIPVKMKLGMYSDVSKFPFSGGYVWISDCCPQRFVSVFSGSIFEGAPHPPSVLLKLIYHWCCQTNVQNVVQWVKVDNFYVKNFFTHMRSVCVAAVHEKHEKLGGPQKRVEVGVISLGTTSQDGNMRQVKVEVLGVMDPESKLVRLRAVEPLQDGERNYKRRFVKILEPLEQWVHKESIILTDFTVDKGTLMGMGFGQVHQSTIPDPPSSASKLSNQNIMEYLRRIVPRMFQNTLSLLSRQIIQQFLDELVWRERWGPVPSQAFDSIITHLAAQTKLDSGESLIFKLGKIAANPFRIWEYDIWKNNGLPTQTYCALNNSGNAPFLLMPSLTPIQAPSNRSAPVSQTISNDSLPSRSDEGRLHHTSIAMTKVFQHTTSEDIQNRLKQAIQKIESEEMSLRKAIATFQVPRSLLLDKAKDHLKSKTSTGQAVFSEDEEADIRDHLNTLHYWGYPFGRWDIRLVVKQYLDTCGRIEHRFKDNFPGDQWIEKFLSRHPDIRVKLCRNIPSRGHTIECDTVKQYILNLSSVATTARPENILNFMEIGLTGDPLRSMTVELRELRYPVGKRKVKSSAAVMLACTAVGKMLPSYIIFEGKPVNITKGPAPGEYYATKTGWFDETAFQHWLESVLLPWADSLPGKKIVIGDSLAQLFSVKTLALCLDKDISFVCMPCNITGVLSPLDVVLCDKLRSQWRSQTRTWASSHSDKYITLDEFPIHIHELLSSTITRDMPEQIRTAFKVIGLYPFNSKHTMQALENGGVSLSDSDDKQDSSQVRKRKRIYIGTEDLSVKKRPVRESGTVIEEVVLDDTETDKDIVDITSVEEALKNREDLVSLEAYYYGTRKADVELVENEFKVNNISAKCPLCQTIVGSNLELMKHLLGHSEKQPTAEELSNICQCRYCLKNCSSKEDLDEHVQEAHRIKLPQEACLICAVKFTSTNGLIVHMQNTHTKLELPYHCSVCNFRSSEQYKLVDHFYEIHAGGEKIQCPFCLKCVAISNLGKKMPANTFFFMHHVRKHITKNSARKCEKCSLWFVHKGILKDHQIKDHISCKDDPNVVPYSSDNKDSVMMPPPKQLPDAIMEAPDTGTNLNINRINFDNLNMHGLEPSLTCIECESKLDAKNHFEACLSCVKCPYTTCCSEAMKKHVVVFHCKSPPVSNSLKIEHLQELVHCGCGFKTRNGDLMAKHLASTSCDKSYCSALDKIASATFPRLVNLDESTGGDPSEEMIKAFASRRDADDSCKEKAPQSGPPSMLNLLGLVRKNSMEDSSDRQTSPPETEDEFQEDRTSSRASSTSSVSRKRSACKAGLDSSFKEVKNKSKSIILDAPTAMTDGARESHSKLTEAINDSNSLTAQADAGITHSVVATENICHNVCERTKGKSEQQILSDKTCGKKVTSPKNVTVISEKGGCETEELNNVAVVEPQCQSGQTSIEHPEIHSALSKPSNIDPKPAEDFPNTSDQQLETSAKDHTSVSFKGDSQSNEVVSNPFLLTQSNRTIKDLN